MSLNLILTRQDKRFKHFAELITKPNNHGKLEKRLEIGNFEYCQQKEPSKYPNVRNFIHIST